MWPGKPRTQEYSKRVVLIGNSFQNSRNGITLRRDRDFSSHLQPTITNFPSIDFNETLINQSLKEKKTSLFSCLSMTSVKNLLP